MDPIMVVEVPVKGMYLYLLMDRTSVGGIISAIETTCEWGAMDAFLGGRML